MDPFIFESEYKIEETIYRSKNSTIYKVKNIKNNGILLVKSIKKKGKYSLTRIKRDYNIPQLIKSDKIIKATNVQLDNNKYYLFYPFLENAKSIDKIDYSNLDFEFLKKLVCDIGRAIKEIHESNIVHRDIKPHNILIHDNKIYIIDFDLSCSLDNSKYPVQEKITGTPLFIAPEIWKQQENINYIMTDIYSFGVTIYYIFNKKNYHIKNHQ
ncbi:tyrosine kinase family protein [Moumouvirus goulette]|uniref:Tyrosine kinase family protein n=1 Tax=Moumouvirus goulette TaxID=1247379 RepID=M1PH48_9VIRU|nr:tyrosine kinase family protein [Moumouvirus goulette]AGF85373.1 tyrosine kinase family protein [Moumouvirus goulette]